MADRESPALRENHDVLPPAEYLNDPSISEWLKQALRGAMQRDPVEAANDADLLRAILFRRALQVEPPDAPKRIDINGHEGTDPAA